MIQHHRSHDRPVAFRSFAPLRAAVCALALVVAAGAAVAVEGIERTPSPEGARVYFIGIADGDTVASPVLVRFGLSDMGVAPAGIDKDKTGHHHLLVDTDLGDPGLPIPSDDQHRHFGGGQTEAAFDLPPGTHTLQLVLADYRHIPHDPPVLSEKITITVE
jgi:hypothetical protein